MSLKMHSQSEQSIGIHTTINVYEDSERRWTVITVASLKLLFGTSSKGMKYLIFCARGEPSMCGRYQSSFLLQRNDMDKSIKTMVPNFVHSYQATPKHISERYS